ncbi:man(5)GlcNAc(2)-PP-dolichol translocation protein RFT1 isoform X2 [Oratosquilla oratoria]
MNVRLHLLYASGLLLSREAFRRAACSAKGGHEVHKLVNLIWIGSLVALPVTGLGWYIWVKGMEPPPESVTIDYHCGVTLMVFCIIVEVMAEAPLILAELQFWIKTKVVIEGMMQLLRSILLASLIYAFPSRAVLVFGVAQLTGSCFFLVAYFLLFGTALANKETAKALPVQRFRQLFPQWRGRLLPEVDPELGSLAWGFFKQGWLKEALTEGEWYLMNFFPLISLAQQGVYQVVNNLGSLTSRLLFRSIEAASYKYFAQMIQRGKPIMEQDKRAISEVVRFLSDVLHNLLLLCLVIVVFGWSYSRTLLFVYGGEKLSESSGVKLMRAQCFYVIFLALNGITEAYTFAAMDDTQLTRYNVFLVSCSVVYMVATVILTQLFGALGFILGNCTNMFLRIVFNMRYIVKQYQYSQHRPLTALWISPGKLLVFAVTFVITHSSEVVLSDKYLSLHILVGFICGCIVVYILRWEFQGLLESVFGFADKIAAKLLFRSKNSLKKSKYYERFLEKDGEIRIEEERLYLIRLLDNVHWFLYRRHLKKKNL